MNIDTIAKNIERNVGAIELLKITISAINRVLCEKELCTEEELKEAFRIEWERLNIL